MNICKQWDCLPKIVTDRLNDANVFFSEEYSEYTLARGERVYFFYDETYIVPLRVKKVLFISAGVFDTEPFCYNAVDSGEREQAFIDNVCLCMHTISVAWVVTAQSSSFNVFPNNSIYAPRGNLIIDLELSEEELFTNVHSKHRNSIRRAEKNGVVISNDCSDEAVNKYALMERETYGRSKQYGSGTRYYQKIADTFSDYADFVFAYKDFEPQAAGVFFYNTVMGYYMHGASINHPEPGAANLLLWSELMKLKAEGVKKFNFVGYGLYVEEGSKYEGIQRFKERFGGQLVKCFNFRYVSNEVLFSLYKCICQLRKGRLFTKYEDNIDVQYKKYMSEKENKGE